MTHGEATVYASYITRLLQSCILVLHNYYIPKIRTLIIVMTFNLSYSKHVQFYDALCSDCHVLRSATLYRSVIMFCFQSLFGAIM